LSKRNFKLDFYKNLIFGFDVVLSMGFSFYTLVFNLQPLIIRKLWHWANKNHILKYYFIIFFISYKIKYINYNISFITIFTNLNAVRSHFPSLDWNIIILIWLIRLLFYLIGNQNGKRQKEEPSRKLNFIFSKKKSTLNSNSWRLLLLF